MKTCSQCHETKPLEDYHRMKASRDGHRAQCKPCLLARDRAYRARNQEDVRARDRARKRRNACTYGTCHLKAIEDGLCDTHHREVSASRESPLDIGGQWVKGVGGVRRWVA